MFEIIMIVAATVAMYRIAEADNQPGSLWGGLTVAACVGAVVTIPLPFVRVFLAAVAMFIAMFVYRLVANK